MRRIDSPQGSPEWWEAHRGRAKEIRQQARRRGCSAVDADLRAAEYFHPLRDAAGDIGAEGALWQGYWYAVAAKDAAKGGAPDRARWYRREAIRGYDEASHSRDGWARDYAFSALLNALHDEGDGRAMRASLDRWKLVEPAQAQERERAWRDKIELCALPPLTDAERHRIIEVMTAWAARHPHPDHDLIAVPGAGTLSPRSLAHHVRDQTDVGDTFMRFLNAARADKSLEDRLATFSRQYLPQAHASHLRRYPIAVRARGRAIEWAALSPQAAVATFAWERMKRSEAFAFSRSGEHGFSKDSDRAAVLFVPRTADAKAYPRSINHVPIRLVRLNGPVRPAGLS